MSGDVIYSGITKAEAIAVAQTGGDGEDSWFVVLLAGEKEVGRVFAKREQVQAARDRLRAWFAGELRGEVRVEWSSWPFGCAAIVYGLAWLSLLSFLSRPNPQGS